MNGDAVLSDRLKSISVCGSRDEVKGRETTERPSNCVRVSDQNGNVIDEPSDTKTEAALKCTKRDDYLSWDEYFMAVAMLSSQRSKDPNRQVGACVVNSENKIVGVGYNGLPIGCHDDDFPWGKKGGFLDTKYAYVCHAEMNAVVNSNTGNVRGCTIYVTLFPCNECTKLLIQSGIKEVVYGTDKYHDASQFVAARKMMSCANVIERRFQTSKKSVQLSLEFP